MAKPKNLTPKLKIPTAEKELELAMNQQAMASRAGGLSLFSTKFKRGYGDAVFGSDENGIWLGAAEFANAPFRVAMDGSLVATSATLGDFVSKTDTGQSMSGDFTVGHANIKIDGVNKRIIINDGTHDRIIIGYDSGGF